MSDTDKAAITRALISVSDKTNLLTLGRFLAERGVEILSTGGSAKTLREGGVSVKDVAEHTGFPEIMDGRVKTLHPLIHGGLLARRDDSDHLKAMADHDIAPIDLVVINLYPFEETVASGAGAAEVIENIDIGGPSMVRSAAKNHAFVTVVTDPDDYDCVMAEIKENNGATSFELRRRLAAKAFTRTAAYDSAISTWFNSELGDTFPTRLTLAGTRSEVLRYGENPHQEAAFYKHGRARPGIATAHQIQGKELSYNNLNDTDAAFELVAEFDAPAIAIIKHANPCGVAIGKTPFEAYKKALACDPVSAFGGIIALNRALDGETAKAIAELFVEVVIAPEISAPARAALAGKKNVRLLETGAMPDPTSPGMTVKSLAGGYLFQSRDQGCIKQADLKTVTKRPPSKSELADLLFAFSVCKHVKSNAIVYAKDGATVGIGAGQMSRIDSARIAAIKSDEAAQAAGETESRTKGCVVASDAFFPFADGLLAAASAGAIAVIQPGGSMRDDEVIKAADEKGLAMVMTGMRHFRH
ncbi:MAG: bifunctional phosphoribosylaminoimidazolecarboxamide formyltransferase/IMP cyclohydrolase [Rhodospirillaceae bacterium]|jgi:phosphoribosylaminoimidazolecarboxamide formyltransferase / IMP cyclohydrolase|nr:bifunctional phosphoribosylaminoimidazolecarboxamide formyltransferase/IMP cyclohydrolase [Rhodospirillaceae bacterium]MBT5374164.1 bifunctional phosphoribosylaminoimidazolecarboxamide formyltransferase/IMP cyclohydrolase [Rhodospirillaceae bacterium]MBT5658529.1 bifunctional phosphoribosylaminoimidazolecarboxamide formyltransferase/IMP cyclohydrolase [Rhodospirillaceae bacterium]